MMEDRIQKPCLGVIPYLDQLMLEEEDSLGLPIVDSTDNTAWLSTTPDRPLRVAVVALPSFSNFTDFDALRAEPSVALRFCRSAAQLGQADIVILPGSKQTVDDLLWMRNEGLDRVVLDYARTGLIVGICGGMQMLGEQILDPHGMETAGSIPGLGLLRIHTTMQPRKTTGMAKGQLIAHSLFGQPVPQIQLKGYEIHIGETLYLRNAEPFAQLVRQPDAKQSLQLDGCMTPDTRIFGTYLHGLFDEDDFRHAFIAAARNYYRLAPAVVLEQWKQKREASLDRLADTVRQSLDMPRIFSWSGLEYRSSSSVESMKCH
jgi:adenosylcobyric acid synthase